MHDLIMEESNIALKKRPKYKSHGSRWYITGIYKKIRVLRAVHGWHIYLHQ